MESGSFRDKGVSFIGRLVFGALCTLGATGAAHADPSAATAANWLISQQITAGPTEGAFPWTAGSTTVYANTQGATALGLLRAYEKDGDLSLLVAATANGNCQITDCIDYGSGAGTSKFPDGSHKFATHDPLFLVELSDATGDSVYNDFVETNFWNRLAAGTYGPTADFDLTDYIADEFTRRSTIPDVVAWDLSKLAIAAQLSGHFPERDALMAAIGQSLEMAGPGSGHTTYDVLALASAVWASATTGVDLNPATGGWAAANSTADLAGLLAGYQVTTGPNAGAFPDTSDAVPSGNSDGPTTSATGYAALALNAQDGVTYAPNLVAGFAYMGTQQSGSGQILLNAGASPTVPGGVESHSEAMEAFAVVGFSPVVYVDDDFASDNNGDSVTFTHPLVNGGVGVPAVVGDNAFATITEALDRVTSGGTIYVAAGIYAEAADLVNNLVIDKPVTILGEQGGVDARTRSDANASVIVPGNGDTALGYASTGSYVISIESDDVTLDGFIIDADNTSIPTGLAYNGTDPDVATGIFAFGNDIHLQNLVVRNILYAGIDGYATGATPSGGNVINQNRFENITNPSKWGIGVLLQVRFYAQVTDNLMDEVRVGVQTNTFYGAAPTGFSPSISNNEIHATRNGIFHNENLGTTSSFAIANNHIVASNNTNQIGQWSGIWIETMGANQSVPLNGNTIDGSALAGSGRNSVGYTLNNIVAGGTKAIDGGSVSNVDVGVLSTDAAFYIKPVEDFLVQNVAFNHIALAAFYVEDTIEEAGTAKLTIGDGNTFTDVAHTLALAGENPQVAFAGSQTGVADVFVRAAGVFFNINPAFNAITYNTTNASINTGIALANVGGIVSVESGSFAQNIALNKSVTVTGPFAGIAGYDASRDGTGEAVINPASGTPLNVTAANASVDGLTFDGAVKNQHVVRNSAPATDFQFLDNRITNVSGAAGIQVNSGTANWTIADNLFRDFANDTTPPARYAQAIKYNSTIGGTIRANHFEHVQSNALQIELNTGHVDVLDNVIDGVAPYYTNTGIQVDSSTSVLVKGNSFTNAQIGMFVSRGNTPGGVTFACNTVTQSSTGISALTVMSGAEVPAHIFDNSLSGNLRDINNQWGTNALIVGSNYYGGGAPIRGGFASLIADPLPADPIGNANCGNNAPVAISAFSGTPQSTPINTPFGQPLVARVTDILGGAVVGETIGFAAPAVGASATLSANSGIGDYNGTMSVDAIANTYAGGYFVTASTGTLPAANFSLINDAATGVFLDLNGPVANVQQGVPNVYTGRILNTGAALPENVVVHLELGSDRAGGIQPGDVVAEYDLGSGWQPLPLAFVGGALVVDYGPASGFPIGAGYDATTLFRFTFNHADMPQTLYSATAGVVGVTSGTVYASDATSTQVVPADTSLSLSLNGPLSAAVNTPTPYSARITNTGSPAPENVVVHFMLGRSGGIQPGDITIAYFDGAAYQPIPLGVCGSQLCGTFGPPSGFAVPNGYDATTPLQVTYARSGTYSVNATADGVNAPFTTYDVASLAVAAGAGAQVDLDGPSAGVEIGGVALYTVRLDNPSADPLSQNATFAFEITDAPATITGSDIFSVEFEAGSGYQTVTAQPNPGPNGGLLYRFDNGGPGYAVAGNATFVGHVKVRFANATTYQLRLVADGTGSPAESYGSDQVDTAVIQPTDDLVFSVTGPVSGVEVGNDTVYIGRLQNNGGDFAEDADTTFCTTRDGNPVTASDLSGTVEITGDGGPQSFPLVYDGAGCVDLGASTLFSGFDTTVTFTINFAEPGVYVTMGTLTGVNSGTQYAADNQSTLVTAPTAGRSLSLDGPLSGVGVGEDVAYLGTFQNSASMIPGNQEFRLCVERNGVPAASGDVGIAYDLDGSGSYATALTLDGSGCGILDTFHANGGDFVEAELRYTYGHIGTFVSTASIRSVANPTTVYASDTATTEVGQGQAIVTLSNLTQAYDGTPRSVTVNTAPGGLTVDVTYDGSTTPPTDAGSYAVVATVNDIDYTGSASGTLVITDTAGISLGLAGPASATATQPSGAWVTGFASTVSNSGGVTSQPVHFVTSVVRIDDNNHDPITASDVDGCIAIGDGLPVDCDAGYFSLGYGKTTGTVGGKPAVLFRYPNVPANDTPLPSTGGAPITAPMEFRFAPGEYRFVAQVIGSNDGTVYATSSTLVTTVPDTQIALAGSFTGSAEQSLLSTTTLTNTGGRLPENAIVRLTLTDASSAPLVSGDAEFAYQQGSNYLTLPWTEQAGALVTYFGPASGFAVPDGYNQTSAGRGIFHRIGQYDLLVEVVDAATLTTVYASDTHAFDIDPLAVAITLTDLNQVYDGTPRPVSVSSAPSIPSAEIDVEYTGVGSTTYGPSSTPPTDAGTYGVTADATGLYAGHASGTLVVNRANAIVTIDSVFLDFTFDGSAHAAVVSTSPPGLAVDVTYDGSMTPPTDVGTYVVFATVTDPNYQGSAIDTLTIDAATAAITIDDDDGTVDGTIHRSYDGAAQIVTSTTAPSGLGYTTTYTGIGSTNYPASATPPSDVGQYQVDAVLADGNHQPASDSATLVIEADASATISIDPASLAATYDGAPHPVSVSTTPSGLAFSVTYDGDVVPPIHAGSYAVLATITDPNYSATATGTLVIAKATGMVTFGATNFTFDGVAHATTAVITQESGDTAACSLTYTPSSVIDAGTYSVEAACVGTDYDASATTTLVISPKPVTIALSGLGTFVYNSSAHAATATVIGGEAGYPATVNVTYNGSAGAPLNAGVYGVVAALDVGSTNYTAAPASGTITITPAAATVSLSDLTQTWDGSPHAVTVATSPSGLTVAVTYDGSATPPTDVGSYAVAATVTDPNYTGSANGILRIVAGDADTIAANGPVSFTGTAGQALAGPLPSVIVTDTGSNPVQGVLVTFAAGVDSGSLSGALQTTDGNGIATLGGWTLDAEAGTNTVTATAAGVSGSVDFTALGDPSGGGLNVSISDSRDYAQTLHVLTYTISVSNSTSSNEAAVGVSDVLPPELDGASAQWQCIPVNGATCTATGSGDIVDTIDLPTGSGVVYLLTALVDNLGSDTVVNTVEVTGSGGTFTASDSTTIVIFRDSFELGGDGAQWPANVPPSMSLGTLDGTASIELDLDPARVPHKPTVIAATPDGALRVDAVRIGEQVWLRMVTRVDGSEQGSTWSRLDSGDALLGTYMDETGTRHVLLIGTVEDLDLPLGSNGPLRLENHG